MRRRFLTGFAGIAVLAALTLAPVAASAASPAVPFKESVSGTISPTGDITFSFAGTGQASHLGNVTFAGTGIDTAPFTNTLTETLTAANGDQLMLMAQQVVTQISLNVFHGVEQWTVIGGTGRFSDATGSGTGDALADFNTGAVTQTLTGTIAY